jgi:hypothetical protein
LAGQEAERGAGVSAFRVTGQRLTAVFPYALGFLPLDTVTVSQLRREVTELAGLGIRAVKVFASSDRRDPGRDWRLLAELFTMLKRAGASQVITYGRAAAGRLPPARKFKPTPLNVPCFAYSGTP